LSRARRRGICHFHREAQSPNGSGRARNLTRVGWRKPRWKCSREQ
jgi:hypothetical protein